MSDEVKLFFYLGLLIGVLFLYYCTDFFDFIFEITLGRAAKKAADSIADKVQEKKQSDNRNTLMNNDTASDESAEAGSSNTEVVTLGSLYGAKPNNQMNQKITAAAKIEAAKKEPQAIASETLGKKFCSDCGAELQTDDRYCHRCGKAVDLEQKNKVQQSEVEACTEVHGNAESEKNVLKKTPPRINQRD